MLRGGIAAALPLPRHWGGGGVLLVGGPTGAGLPSRWVPGGRGSPSCPGIPSHSRRMQKQGPCQENTVYKIKERRYGF